MKLQNFCLSMLFAISLSGCSLMPRATLQGNIPFFYGGVITIYNSAGKNIVLVPQSQNNGFPVEYKYGKRRWYNLGMREKIVTKVAGIRNGESLVLPIYRNTTRTTVYVPVAVKVLRIKNGKTKVLGFYNFCCAVPPNRDSNFDINFGKRELQQLKSGYTGQGCNSCGGYSWVW